MSRGGAQFKRALIFVHRWMGVLFCLLFLTWFASGIVMMYWQYPEVTPDDRLSRAPALDASRIHSLAAGGLHAARQRAASHQRHD